MNHVAAEDSTRPKWVQSTVDLTQVLLNKSLIALSLKMLKKKKKLENDKEQHL